MGKTKRKTLAPASFVSTLNVPMDHCAILVVAFSVFQTLETPRNEAGRIFELVKSAGKTYDYCEAKESSQTSSLLLLQSRVENEVQQNASQVFNHS